MGQREPAKRDAERTVGTSFAARTLLGRASAPVARRRTTTVIAGLVLVLASLAAGSIASAPHAAAAEQASVDPSPAPAPPESTTPPRDELPPAAPEITSPADRAAVTSATTTISGSKSGDTGVRLETDGDVLCTVPAGPGTSFSCGGIVLPPGGNVVVHAVSTLADGTDAGPRSSIRVVSVPPPVVSASGSRPVNGLVTGSGIPGARVSVTSSSGESCSLEADASGAWACLLTGSAPDGVYRLSASQEAPFAPGVRSDSSAPTTVVLDRTAPRPPVVTAPTSGSAVPAVDIRFSGTGEEGATVTVFVGSGSVCQAIVSSGRWSCVAATLAPGDARVVAVQKDTAANSSTGSDAVALVIGTVTGSPTPAPSTPATAPPTAPGAAPTPDQPDPTEGPTESASPGGPSAPGTPGALPPAPPEDDAWDATTPFSVPLSPLLASGTGVDVLRAVVLAALVAATVALGALLLLRGAPAADRADGSNRRLVLTGRNRGVVPITRRTDAPDVTAGASAVTVLFALLAVAGILILSRPVDGTPAYARLLFAAVTATAVVALVSVVVPSLIARWLGAGRLHVAIDPRGFLIVAGAAAASRIFDLDPPVLFAVVVTASTAAAVGRATEARIAGARIASLALLGVLAGTAGILIGPALQPGFASSLVIETLNVLTAAALGSATIMLIPLGTSTGRSLWAGSRSGWLLLAIPVVALEVALLGSRSPEAADAVTTIGLVGVVACCALFLSVWIWRRFVAPELARDA